MVGGGRPLVEDALQLKRPFGGETTSKQGRKLRLGMLTVLTNIRSIKVLWQVEDELWWKMTFGGRRPQVEGDICQKMTFNERRPSVEDDLQWKMTFGERQPLMKDGLQWKTIFVGRRPMEEDDLWVKTTFSGRQTSEDLACCLLCFAVFFFKKGQ